MGLEGWLSGRSIQSNSARIVSEGIVKLTDCRLVSALLHEAKPLKLRKAAVDYLPRFRSKSG